MVGTSLAYIVEDQAARVMLARQAKPENGPLAKRLGEYLQRSTQGRFETQTAPDGTVWQPLTRRYAKRKKYNQDKILTLRGYLRGLIRYQTIDDNTVEIGSDRKYAAIHQFGGDITIPSRPATVRYRSKAGRVLFASKKHTRGVKERAVTIPAHTIKMPARPFLGISVADDQEIRDIIRDWVVQRGAKR